MVVWRPARHHAGADPDTWEDGLRAALIIGATALALAACVNTGEIEGHKVRGTAEPPAETVSENYLHRAAPQWFKDYWAKYLRHAHGYSVMAVDRNARGAFYVYCSSACQNLTGSTFQSWKDVNYKHEALEKCREWVRKEFPAAKPNCAIYAIKDKIVW